jgi:hypothetical protein
MVNLLSKQGSGTAAHGGDDVKRVNFTTLCRFSLLSPLSVPSLGVGAGDHLPLLDLRAVNSGILFATFIGCDPCPVLKLM